MHDLGSRVDVFVYHNIIHDLVVGHGSLFVVELLNRYKMPLSNEA